MKTYTQHSFRDRVMRRAIIASLAYISAIHAVGAAVTASESGATLEEVIVTARQRDESLQNVPDSVTAFTAKTITEAGITNVGGFMDKTPNVFFRQAFRSGASYITVRGIGTGQNGWAPVTLVVDGIPTATLEGFNTGTLFDLERIEVLKGPQSALYGAGAIAGAVNIITKEPLRDLEADAQLIVAKGDDVRANTSVSGPLGKLFRFRLAGSFRDSDGVYEDTDGRGLDIELHKAVRARLIADFSTVSIDLRAFLVDSRPGAYMQEALPETDPVELQKAINDFDSSPTRGIIGREDRDITEYSGRISWQLPIAELSVIAGRSKIEQHGVGSATWLKPPAPVSFCGPVGGAAQPADCFQDNTDNVTSTTADVRLTSPSEQRLRWMVGAAYIERETLNSFFLDEAFTDSGGDVTTVRSLPIVFGSTHLRNDELVGFYGQFNYDITEETELTLAGRWDRNKYDSTQYADETLSQTVPAADGTITQQNEDSEFQPKAQLSYRWTDDVMNYVSVARGFRTGYFNSGAFTAPETTWNYELGLKAVVLDGKLSFNSAVYHIDYSNQQFSFVTATPPFRASTNIPSTSIDGAEIEVAARPTPGLSLGAGLGVADARVADGTEAPNTPKFTLNLYGSYDRPIGQSVSWFSRVDYRRQGAYYLERGNRFSIEPKDYLNLRTSLNWDRWSAGLWVENLLDERQTNELLQFGFQSVRAISLPRAYGLEFRYSL